MKAGAIEKIKGFLKDGSHKRLSIQAQHRHIKNSEYQCSLCHT